jgi:nitrite reductase/ring-hydroxylating ferredoxin subunit
MKLDLELRPRAHGGLNLAASWYIALPSRELAAKPKALELFGEPLVAWRDGHGRAVIMPRHCPHMGASLAAGKVVDGCLQCPFHHWRFAGSGQCVEVPGIERIPAAARQITYPVVEKYGYIWAWYGSVAPMYPLPEIPALEAGCGGYRSFRFADATAATVRRILENTYDPDHLAALHGIEVNGPLQLTLLSDQQAARDNGPPIAADAWFGAVIEWPSYAGKLGIITRLLGQNAEKFTLLVDGWPGGQRITYFSDGVEQYRLLLATTPIAANRTIQHIAVAIATTGRFWSDLAKYLVNRVAISFASNQDLPIFNTIQPGDGDGIYVKRDLGIVRFREYYQQWVNKAAAVVESGHGGSDA